MNKTYEIPSKYSSNEIMLKSCTGHIPVKNQATLAPQSLVSVRQTERVDIRVDSGYGLGGVDFITATPIDCQSIITNPPFNLASGFITKSLECAQIVAMLFKSQVWHAENKAKLFALYPPTYVLALDWRPDFLNGKRGGAPTMECLWTVWIQGKTDTRYRILNKPNR